MKEKKISTGSFPERYVVSIDMGSPGSKEKESKFAWCDNGENREGSLDIDKLILALSSKTYFAMGIEAPLFIPLRPKDLKNFTGARTDFDMNHPWSAGAGATVTAINLAFLGSLLTKIHEEHPKIAVTTDMDAWNNCGDNCIFIWESFISGKSESGKTGKPVNSHIADAQTALKLFQEQQRPVFMEHYLNLPFAIAQAVGLKTIGSSKAMLIVKGAK